MSRWPSPTAAAGVRAADATPVAPPVGLPRVALGLGSGGSGLSRLDHLARFGALPAVTVPARRSDAALIELVEQAGLRGRGGAGFPTATKLRAVASGRRRPIVVANGSEGEPASSKDRVLLTGAPHLVIDGVVIAARAVGAEEAVICVDRHATRAAAGISAAVAERAGSDAVAIRVVGVPGRYVAGEESALVHFLNGGEAKPTFQPPRVFERGVAGRPTLVQNVETLAHLALIARFGADWFRAIGSADEPGSLLVTVSGGVNAPGVCEVALGTPITDVIAAAGGAAEPIGALLVGGYFGRWLPASVAAEAALSTASLRSVGASLGAGIVAVLPASRCGLAETARVVRWLAGENAQQCGPCMFGLPAIAGALDRLVAGDARGRAENDLRRWLDAVEGRGACRHPDGVVRLVQSALMVFASEIAGHRRHGPCPASGGGAVLPLPATASRGWR